MLIFKGCTCWSHVTAWYWYNSTGLWIYNDLRTQQQSCNTWKRNQKRSNKIKKIRVWSSPCENSPCCGQSLEGWGRATTFSPSRADLRWLSNPRKELLFWTTGKHTSSPWSPSSSSTVWLLLVDTIRRWKKRDKHRFKERKSRKKMFCLLLFIFIYTKFDQQLFLVPELHIIFFFSGAEIYSDFFALF